MADYNITYEFGEKLRKVLAEIIQPENIVYDEYSDKDDNKNIYQAPGHDNYLLYVYNENRGHKVSCYAKERDAYTGRLTYVSKFVNGVLIPDEFTYVGNFLQLSINAFSKNNQTQQLPDDFFDMDEDSQQFTWEII